MPRLLRANDCERRIKPLAICRSTQLGNNSIRQYRMNRAEQLRPFLSSPILSDGMAYSVSRSAYSYLHAETMISSMVHRISQIWRDEKSVAVEGSSSHLEAHSTVLVWFHVEFSLQYSFSTENLFLKGRQGLHGLLWNFGLNSQMNLAIHVKSVPI